MTVKWVLILIGGANYHNFAPKLKIFIKKVILTTFPPPRLLDTFSSYPFIESCEKFHPARLLGTFFAYPFI